MSDSEWSFDCPQFVDFTNLEMLDDDPSDYFSSEYINELNFKILLKFTFSRLNFHGQFNLQVN